MYLPDRKRRLSGEGLTLAVLTLVVFLFCGLPLLLLLRYAVFTTDGFSLLPLVEALSSRSVQRALWNSLESSFLSAFLATIVGAVLALAIGLTNIRFKALFVFFLLLPMMIPPHVTAIAWIQALGPASPVLQWFGVAPEAGSTHPIYSREGIVALLTIQHSPLVFLVVRAALRSFPRELSDAARSCGASHIHDAAADYRSATGTHAARRLCLGVHRSDGKLRCYRLTRCAGALHDAAGFDLASPSEFWTRHTPERGYSLNRTRADSYRVAHRSVRSSTADAPGFDRPAASPAGNRPRPGKDHLLN